jgi:hypothetical protein
MGSDNLVENNIFQHITGPLMGGGATPGLVEAYNYAIDDYYTASLTWMQGSNYAHAAGDGYILHEGNDGVGFTADLVHGTHNFLTAFRNYFTGFETGKTAQTVPINLYAFSRYFNMIGNVLGTPGFHTNYESVPPSFTAAEKSIYRLGSNGNTLPASKQDPLVKSTLFRWGNYDVATGTARFLASEVPTGLSQFANGMPATQNLPASLYLAGKPGWWPPGTPWPCIGPDVSGGDMANLAGHAYKIPARNCYDRTSKTNGILNFNADSCYGSSYTGVQPFSDRAVASRQAGIMMYSNPVHGKIYIEASGVASARVTISTIDGKSVFQKSMSLKSENVLDLSGLSRGIYCVKVSDNSISSYQRMMIAR